MMAKLNAAGETLTIKKALGKYGGEFYKKLREQGILPRQGLITRILTDSLPNKADCGGIGVRRGFGGGG